jgi:hypothetical protein
MSVDVRGSFFQVPSRLSWSDRGFAPLTIEIIAGFMLRPVVSGMAANMIPVRQAMDAGWSQACVKQALDLLENSEFG